MARRFQIELSEVDRANSTGHLDQARLDEGLTLAVGDQIEVRDERCFCWDATVQSVESSDQGTTYRLSLSRALQPGSDRPYRGIGEWKSGVNCMERRSALEEQERRNRENTPPG